MISIDKTDNQPKQPSKTLADVKKEVAEQVLAQMEKLNKKPLSDNEKAAAQKLADLLASNTNLKDMGIIM